MYIPTNVWIGQSPDICTSFVRKFNKDTGEDAQSSVPSILSERGFDDSAYKKAWNTANGAEKAGASNIECVKNVPSKGWTALGCVMPDHQVVLWHPVYGFQTMLTTMYFSYMAGFGKFEDIEFQVVAVDHQSWIAPADSVAHLDVRDSPLGEGDCYLAELSNQDIGSEFLYKNKKLVYLGYEFNGHVHCFQFLSLPKIQESNFHFSDLSQTESMVLSRTSRKFDYLRLCQVISENQFDDFLNNMENVFESVFSIRKNIMVRFHFSKKEGNHITNLYSHEDIRREFELSKPLTLSLHGSFTIEKNKKNWRVLYYSGVAPDFCKEFTSLKEALVFLREHLELDTLGRLFTHQSCVTKLHISYY